MKCVIFLIQSQTIKSLISAQFLLFVCLFVVLSSAYMKTSPISVNSWKIWVYYQKGYLSCHICCDTNHQLLRVHPKGLCQYLTTFYGKQGVLKTYFNTDPHGSLRIVYKVSNNHSDLQQLKSHFNIINIEDSAFKEFKV